MNRIPLDPDSDLLGVIDVQPDFMPGGALPVADGDAVLPVIGRLLSGPFRHAFATQDWHPADHLSFASQHPGRAPYESVALPYGAQTLWPDHCVQGGAGAALHAGLDQARIEAVIRKGFRRPIDSYSAFFENDRRTPTGLDGYLRERGARRLFLAGLATDFCVAYSAEDAARLGYAVTVVEDACRAIALPLPDGGDTLTAAWARLAALGVQRVRSDALVPG
ncbi:bifunctional nicotinamidase/pyrazinamidase [Roseomonas sp. NAR14]|uniref:nicotinamidase n=1 Tax=Roseomonas acroporae TaxID=2937791 RepID=A0A9X1Y5R8_9PROT|nr:bifunctional nicotinamidase/pyrazinamidase [Roseomonas acroporae]MCK8784744.1 bifunctional nicotinamidase/pyrazinamidase [Roseomonas acroporae]